MNKLSNLQQILKQMQVDAALITDPHNVFYLTGFNSDPKERLLGVMVFAEAEPFLICPAMEAPDAKAAGWMGEIAGHTDTQDAMHVLYEIANKRKQTMDSIAIEKAHMTVDRYDAINRYFQSPEIHAIDDQLNAMRVVKDERELDILRHAAGLADYAIEVAAQTMCEGMTEIELMTEIETALKKRGITHMSFDTTVLTGPKAASPHGKTGDRKIKKGDLVLMDLGVIYEGYCSDITRTLAFGEPGEQAKEIYEIVRLSEQAALEAVRPGVTAAELDGISRSVIEKAGYGEYFTHRLGHGLGISVHEFPSIHGGNDMPLQEGMVFTIEPGIYIPGQVGVRIEDDVAVTKEGYEVLTNYPKQLTIINP